LGTHIRGTKSDQYRHCSERKKKGVEESDLGQGLPVVAQTHGEEGGGSYQTKGREKKNWQCLDSRKKRTTLKRKQLENKRTRKKDMKKPGRKWSLTGSGREANPNHKTEEGEEILRHVKPKSKRNKIVKKEKRERDRGGDEFQKQGLGVFWEKFHTLGVAEKVNAMGGG